VNRSEMRSIVQDLTGRDDKDSLINSAFDLAYRHFCQRHDFRSMISEESDSISEGDAYVSLPSGTHHLLEARIIDGQLSYALDIRSKLWLVKRWPNISALAEAKPSKGYVEGSKLYLYPVSDGDYDVYFTITKIPSFSDDSTDNTIPELDNALVYWASAFVFQSLKMIPEAREWFSMAEKEFIEAKRTDMRDNRKLKHVGFNEDVEDLHTVYAYLDPFAKES